MFFSKIKSKFLNKNIDRNIGIKNCFIDACCEVKKDCKIYQNNYIKGNTKIGSNCQLYPNNIIIDSNIFDGVKITSSVIENSVIKSDCTIGPFAHLREKSVIEEKCKIGNFCEIKNSIIGKGTKVSHLAYIGDAKIGQNCNIGCGVIFANYNGKIKQQIIVEDDVFIGCNCVLIAPLKIAKGTYICADTTVTKDTNENDFVIGRVRAESKPNRAFGRYLK